MPARTVGRVMADLMNLVGEAVTAVIEIATSTVEAWTSATSATGRPVLYLVPAPDAIDGPEHPDGARAARR